MKTINKITTSLFVLCLFLGFTACTEKIGYSPADVPGNAQVYFPSTLPSRLLLSQDMNVKSQDIALYRIDKTAALTVNLTVENGSPDIFNVPTTAAFAAGSEAAKITITYDPVKLGYDVYKSIKISITDQSLTSEYGSTSYAFTTGIPAPWKSLGLATYTDDFVSTFFGVSRVPYQVEIQEHMLIPGFYRLVNPYGAAYPYNEPGDWDNSKDHYLEINAHDPAGVYIPHSQPSGMDWGYGEFKMSSLAGRNIANGSTLEAQKAAGNCGTYENGIITFPTRTLLISMAKYPASSPGGWYYANLNGWFQLIMPGVVLADYSVGVQYMGRFADPDDNYFAMADITLGADVESAKVAMVSGSMTQEALDGVIDGSIESVEVHASGHVKFPVAKSGVYTFVVVSYANNEAQDFDYATFNFIIGSAPEYTIDDFKGNFHLTGSSQFGDADADMDVVIKAGAEKNTFIITGIDLCAEVKATFDPETKTMSIAPQPLADYGKYDITLYTTTPDGDVSETAAMDFIINSSGNLVMSPTSEADGYLLNSDVAGGWVDGYYDLVFTKQYLKAANVNPLKAISVHKNLKRASATSNSNGKNLSKDNFSIRHKVSSKDLLLNVNANSAF